nr:tyrosine-type recombinase/integrase [uncultured Ruminococcus sp.]
MPIYKQKAKKNGKYQYKVVVCYTDKFGVNRQIAARVYGYDEAKAKERELQYASAEHDLSSKMTVQQLYDEYIAAKQYEIRQSSLMKTKSILKNHVLNDDISGCHLDKLTAPVMQRWKNNIAQKDIMISTKNNAYRELNALLNYALRMDYIPKNPLKVVGRFKDVNFTPRQERMRVYTAEQFHKYITVARESCKSLSDYGCYIFFNIAFYTGMRKGEIHALKWSDIKDGVIQVRRSINQKIRDENGNYLEGPPKNESSCRDLKAPANLLKLLEEHKRLLSANIGYSDDFRICGGYKPIPDTTIEKHNIKYAEAAGLSHIKIHEFRHSHATMLINGGVNIVVVSHRLGHKDVQETLNTYAHLYPASEDSVLDLLEAN